MEQKVKEKKQDIKMDKLKITIGIIATTLIGGVAYDDLTLTSTEVQEIREMVDFTANEDLIYKTILLDKKKVEFDLSVISKKEVDDILMGTMTKLGIKQQDLIDKIMRGEDINFDKEISKKSKSLTSIIR